MIKSYKIRLYPTKEQETLMWKHIGCCRFIWNYMLSYQEERYKAGEKHLSAFGMIKHLTTVKKDGDHDWLYEVSNTSLQIICQDLGKAYADFFKKAKGFPKFKSKKWNKPTFPVRCEAVYFIDNSVNIEKIGKVKYRTDFDIPQGMRQKFSNTRISYINGKWILSLGMECENQAQALSDKSMGIDLGVKDLAIVAFGEEQFVFHNINKSKKMRDIEKRIKYLQRTTVRKYEYGKSKTGKYEKTNNIIRSEEKLRKLYARAKNIRANYIHQTTHELVSMLPKRVVMEDLDVYGMLKNRYLSKVIQEQCFYEFTRQMQYKCECNGIEFVQVDRFYPSSKTCSTCGYIKKDLKLSDRTYVCPECGAVIDRDYNAAINLMRYVA